VASQGRSQSAFERRAAFHAWASARLSGRTVTLPWCRVAGHPGGNGLMVAPDDLLDGVLEDRCQHLETVLHATS
jgi:hypothetical protein